MHIFHDWKVVFKQSSKGVKTTMQFGRPVYEENVDTINVVEKCSVCSRKRAYAKESSGKQWPLDVDYIEFNYNEGEPL